MFFLMSFWLASSIALESILGSSGSSSLSLTGGLAGGFVWPSWARMAQPVMPRGTPEAKTMVRNFRLDLIIKTLRALFNRAHYIRPCFRQLLQCYTPSLLEIMPSSLNYWVDSTLPNALKLSGILVLALIANRLLRASSKLI